MQGHNVLFDWENQRVGFAESSCEYEEAMAMTDDGFMSVDCKLSAPSLSVSCTDLSSCDKMDGSNVVDTTALEGLEIWTRVVQSPGTPHGLACEEQHNEANGGGPMEVNCVARESTGRFGSASFLAPTPSLTVHLRRNRIVRRRNLECMRLHLHPNQN